MEEIFFCPNCMEKTAPVNGKCPVCGCDVNVENAPHQQPVKSPRPAPPKKRFITTCASALAVMAVCIAVYAFSSTEAAADMSYTQAAQSNIETVVRAEPALKLELGMKNKKTEDKKPESAELSLSIDNALLNETTLSTYRTNTVGLRSDGTVVAAGSNEDGECDVSDWRDIIAVSTGKCSIVGLKSDGTVAAVGYNEDGKCEVSGWRNITAISSGEYHTVGLRADGTVVAAGSTIDGQCSVSGWRDIVAVSAGSDFTAGLRSDGTVVATGQLFDVSGWKDIAAISAGGAFLAGLKPDGTVLVAVPQGLVTSAWADVAAWTDIVAISAGGSHIVGLRSDGTVVAAGFNESSACKVSDWTGIAAISAGDGYTLGLCADGTVITTKYTGEYDYGQCDVTGWRDIRLPVTDSDTDNDIIAAGTL